jgi:hypothetical protein
MVGTGRVGLVMNEKQREQQLEATLALRQAAVIQAVVIQAVVI